MIVKNEDDYYFTTEKLKIIDNYIEDPQRTD
jgi:hypothetical protein